MAKKSTKAAAAAQNENVNTEVQAQKPNYQYTNEYRLSGRLAEDATISEKDGKRRAVFRVIHNFTKKDALTLRVTMFETEQRPLPEDLLKKGAAVIVSGYKSQNNYNDKNGEKQYAVDHIATSLVPAEFEDVIDKATGEVIRKKMKSVNSFAVTGCLAKDAISRKTEKGEALRFTVMHNVKKPFAPLAAEMTMFSKNRGREVKLPYDLLAKGKRVLVKGYMKNSSYEKDNKPVYVIDNIVTSAIPCPVVE